MTKCLQTPQRIKIEIQTFLLGVRELTDPIAPSAGAAGDF